MLVPTDHIELMQSLGAYAYSPAAPAELASKLQTTPGSPVDRIFTSIEILYAFREQLDSAGLTVLAQLAGFAQANRWDFPAKPGRMQAIYDSTLGAIGEIELAPEFVQPEPVTIYRADAKDWREDVAPDLDRLKAGRRAKVNELKLLHETAGAPTPFGVVDSDDSSKIKITGLVNMALIATQSAQPFTEDWTLADNSVVTLDANGAITMGVAVGQFVAAVHAHARALKTQIDAITVVDGDLDAAVAELAAIDITAGWPTITP